MAVAISYITQVANDANLTNFTFSNVDIGTPSAGRLVVVSVDSQNNESALSGMTIGGNAANLVTWVAGRNMSTHLYSLRVAAGSTATITVNHSGGTNGCSIAVFTVTGHASDTPFHVATPSGGGNSNRSVSVNIPADGGVIACHAGPDEDATWTNVPKQFTYDMEGNMNHSGGSKITSMLLSGHSISANRSRALIAASWAPSEGFSGIYLGDTQINAIKHGSDDVVAVYHGETKIFEAG